MSKVSSWKSQENRRIRGGQRSAQQKGKVLSQRGHLVCLGVSLCRSEREKEGGTDKTLLPGEFLASRKTELHWTDYSILRTISVLLVLQ